jgi:FkbM family methyltransferase
VYSTLSLKRLQGKNPQLGRQRCIHFTVSNTTFPFYIETQLDFDVLWDSMCEDQYELKNIVKDDIRVIFDLGSNIGTTVIRFYLKFPNATIYAFEPDPHNFERLQQNTAELKEQYRIKLFHRAISNEHNKDIPFYIGTKNHWSSSMMQRRNTGEEVMVKSAQLDALCAEQDIEGIDIVKMDIEGAEDLALDGFTMLRKTRYFIGEMHPSLMRSTIKEFIDRIEGFEILAVNTSTGIFKFKNSDLGQDSA